MLLHRVIQELSGLRSASAAQMLGGAARDSIIAGMAAGADSIDDLDLLRAGGMPRLFNFSGPRSPTKPLHGLRLSGSSGFPGASRLTRVAVTGGGRIRPL
jgi:hypothetical protein